MREPGIADGKTMGDSCPAVVTYKDDLLGLVFGALDVEDRGESLENGSTNRSLGVLTGRWQGRYTITWQLRGKSVI